MERTYNVSEAAEKIGVSVKTLQRWDRDGKLVSKRTPSNRRYYTESQLAEIMEGENNMEKYYVIENRKVVVKWEGKEIIVSMEMQRRVADLYVYDA